MNQYKYQIGLVVEYITKNIFKEKEKTSLNNIIKIFETNYGIKMFLFNFHLDFNLFIYSTERKIYQIHIVKSKLKRNPLEIDIYCKYKATITDILDFSDNSLFYYFIFHPCLVYRLKQSAKKLLK